MPRYVRPMEDQIYSVGPHVHASASQSLQRLMALDFAYPVREDGTSVSLPLVEERPAPT